MLHPPPAANAIEAFGVLRIRIASRWCGSMHRLTIGCCAKLRKQTRGLFAVVRPIAVFFTPEQAIYWACRSRVRAETLPESATAKRRAASAIHPFFLR